MKNVEFQNSRKSSRTESAGPPPCAACLCAMLLLLALFAPPPASQAQPQKEAQASPASSKVRNVLFIMSDDHAAYATGAYADAAGSNAAGSNAAGSNAAYSRLARTPHLDRLAAEGMRFDRAYANAPVCTPSRQSIVTGQLPHAVGVNLLFTPLSEETTTIADHLEQEEQSGVATAAIGKMHFVEWEGALRSWGYPEEVIERADARHGFDYRVTGADYERHLEEHPPRGVPDSVRVRPSGGGFEEPALLWNAGVRPAGVYAEDSQARFFAEKAARFMRERKAAGERFYVTLSFHEPHAPFNFPVEYAGRYRPGDMPDPPEASPEDERWVPEVFRGLSEREKRGIVASYLASVEHLDAQIGYVLDRLEAMGLAEETLVVYASDHGYLLGHHGRFEKHTMWEEAVRIPLIMRGPGVPAGESNATRSTGATRSTDATRSTGAMVEGIDLVPTFLEALGAEPLPTVQGKSFWAVAQGQREEHRRSVFSEHLADELAMVRTERWKYVFMSGSGDLSMGYAIGHGAPGRTEWLYDLRSDPGETESVAAERPQVLRRMRGLMLRRFLATHPEAAQLPLRLSVTEQLKWLARPRDPLPPSPPIPLTGSQVGDVSPPGSP